MVPHNDFDFFLKQYNTRKKCHRKPRKSRATTATNKVRLAKKSNENTIHSIW